MDFKQRYLLAKKNGLVERFRGEEISKEISKTVPNNDQQSLQTNMINDLLNGVEFSHMEEWEKYQAVRVEAKKIVDAKIAAIEAELEQ
jgi:hypothetical protein